MTKAQWLKYISIIEDASNRGKLTHQDKVKIINRLIDKERAEWDQIELEHMGLEKKDK